MCTASALLAVICLASSFVADEPNSQVNEQVRFDGRTLGLAFEGEDPGATIREYLPAGEKLDNWTRLAAIRRYEHLDDPVAYAETTIKQLKQKYPQSPSAIVKNLESGAVVLDFVVWPDDASYVEFNVFRYEKRPGGGLISQQYAVRAYGDKAEPFLMGLRDVRRRLVEKMAGHGLQLETKTSAHKGPSE